jgi:hypothetical protein
MELMGSNAGRADARRVRIWTVAVSVTLVFEAYDAQPPTHP